MREHERVAATLAALLIGCHPKPDAVREQEAGPAPSASVAVVVADAGPPPERPLAWGTLPPAAGPLYPVIDGVCGFGTIRALEGKTIYTEGATFARFEDDGLVSDAAYERVAEKSKTDNWGSTTFEEVSGSWPRLVLFSRDVGLGRVRDFESIWVHEEAGWSYFGSSQEKGQPSYARPTQFQDWLVSARRGMDPSVKNWSDGPNGATLMQAWPMRKGAAPIPGLASLARKDFQANRIESAGDSLYAFGWDQKSTAGEVMRVLKDGKVTEGTHPHAYRALVGKKDDSLFVLGDDGVIRRYDGTKATALPFKLASGRTIVGAGLAPSGDVWALTSKSEVMVLHDDAVTTTPLPEPSAKTPSQSSLAGAQLGLLTGVEREDPYAVDESGVLFHFETGKWQEVPMPAPPFSTNGKYRVRNVLLAAIGDLFVSTDYFEKGIGWKNARRYGAVLRTRRPKETQRCNEAAHQTRIDLDAIGHGFFSAPPAASDTCATPFVVILRLGTKAQPTYLYDAGYSTLRTAIKETPGLGATADIVEIPWGSVQAIGMKAPDMATARALAASAAKHVKSDFIETRPEIVCGVPPSIDKTLTVDVATGKLVKPDAH